MSYWKNNSNMSALIHDTNSALGLIRDTKKYLQREMRKAGVMIEKYDKQLDNIDTFVDRALKAIDSFYTKEKALYEQKTKGSQ